MIDRSSVGLVLQTLEQSVKELDDCGTHDMRRAIELNGAAKLAMGAAYHPTTVLLLTAAALLKLHAETKAPSDVLASLARVIKDVIQADNDDNEPLPF